MYHSLGVINPSKSEGWGNSADQATLLGNQAILSDIAVHKEQKKKNYIYFRSNDHIELSKILIKSTNYKKKKVVTKLQKNLQHKYITTKWGGCLNSQHQYTTT